MARPAPGATRSVAVLELLAAQPDERFTLSEIARRCDLNKATAHALLSALTERRVLLRHPVEKRYSLGPTMVIVGDAARRGYTPVDFAAPVLRRLADDTGLWARLRSFGGGEAVDVVEAGRPAFLRGFPPVRVPLVPPVGAVAMAYADTAMVEAWLARAPVAERAADAAAALPGIRSEGFTVKLASIDAAEQPGGAPGTPPQGDEWHARLGTDAHQHQLPGPDRSVPAGRIVDVAAPVFGPRGVVSLGVSLTAIDGRSRSDADVRALAARVKEAADELTALSGGGRH